MAEGTPLEQAKEFLRWAMPYWRGTSYDSDQNPHLLTRTTVLALVEQIELDEQRLADAGAHIARLRDMIIDDAIEEKAG